MHHSLQKYLLLRSFFLVFLEESILKLHVWVCSVNEKIGPLVTLIVDFFTGSKTLR